MKKTKSPPDFSKYILKGDVYAGLDMSLTNPGICILDGNLVKFYFFPCRKKHIDYENSNGKYSCKALGYYQEFSSREQRYSRIVNDIMDVFDGYKDRDLKIAIENYAFGAKGRAQSGLYELGGAVRMSLYTRKLQFTEIPPTTVKKYATGNGTANKVEMVANFFHLTKLSLYDMFDLSEPAKGDVPGPISDVCDAYYIASMVAGKTVSHANIINNIMANLKEKTRGK
jgi:Holliday junction resolvasome RuvABC endonuclease subunit